MLIHKKAVSVILLILGLSFSGSSYANAENSSDDKNPVLPTLNSYLGLADDEGNIIVDILRITSLMEFDDKGNLDDKNLVLPTLNSYLGLAEIAAGARIFALSESIPVMLIRMQGRFRFFGGALIVQGLFTVGDSVYMVRIKEKK